MKAQLFAPCLLLGCVLLGGCGHAAGFDPAKGPELKRVALPGFVLLLPEGSIVKSTTSPYAGSYRLKLTEGPSLVAALQRRYPEWREVRVLWQSGYTTVDDLPGTIQVLANSLGMDLQERKAPAPGQALGVGAANGKALAFGFAFCGGVFVNVIYSGPSNRIEEVEATTGKIMASLKCSERALKLGPLLPRLDWNFLYGKVASQQNGQFYSLDGDAMYVNLTGNDVTPHHEFLKNFAIASIHSMAELGQVEVSSRSVPYSDKHGEAVSLLRFDWSRAGQPNAFYLAARYCPDLDVSFLTVIEPVRAEDAAAIRIAKGIQCPGAEEPQPPTVDEAFGHACSAGTQRACERWKELAAVGEADGP